MSGPTITFSPDGESFSVTPEVFAELAGWRLTPSEEFPAMPNDTRYFESFEEMEQAARELLGE